MPILSNAHYVVLDMNVQLRLMSNKSVQTVYTLKLVQYPAHHVLQGIPVHRRIKIPSHICQGNIARVVVL